MFAFILIPLFAGLILAASVRFQRENVDHRLTILLLASYALRLIIAPLSHSATLFSNGGGGIDSSSYELGGQIIARLWQYTGIHYVSGDDLPGFEQVSLPPNIFACVIYLNGGMTHLGCVSVVAAATCILCLDLHLLSLQLGARRNVALGVTALISVLPSFLYYTSDTYKDGLVALFVLGIFGCSVRLARKFSLVQLAWAMVLLGGLWLTRFYLVFVMPAPLLLGVLGLRSGSMMRILLAVLVIGGSVTAAYAYSDVPVVATHHAMQTFQAGTSPDVLNENADSGGSGVNLGTGPASFLPRVAYTLFSPFPWQSGSLGLQIAKIEALVWYYFFYRAVRSALMLWRERFADLLMFLSFIVPITVAYAFSFSNIGLIVRQRIDIVLATIVLASVSWSAPGALVARAPSPRPEDPSSASKRARALGAGPRDPRPQW